MKFGLVGAGFMGKVYAIGFKVAGSVFDLPISFEAECVAEATPDRARAAQTEYGFAHATDNWCDVIDDPSIGLVCIAAPNALHKEIALAAIAAGKHVYCEKPLAPTARDTLEMVEAAEAAGVKTQVGFNYLANPMIRAARDMISSGELGDIRSYRGVHAEDYMADAGSPWTFRHDPAGGGAAADIGSHALATAEHLLGPISAVMGHCRTIVPERRDAGGRMRPVEVDDVAHAMVEFECGASGTIEANWAATGRKMQHEFEVYGSKGALLFNQERLNELHLYSVHDAAGRQGFRRIEASSDHPPYGDFCTAPGHQIGFNDLKAIEIAGFAGALADEAPEPFNFRAGHRVQMLVEAIQSSSETRSWVSVGRADTAQPVPAL